MDCPVHILRAFTSTAVPALGNPAGVVLLENMPEAGVMQRIAIEAQQPITAFLEPRNDERSEFNIRYYDLNGRECHICGHATLAAVAQLKRMTKTLDGKDITFYLNPEQFAGHERYIKGHIYGESLGLDMRADTLKYMSDFLLYEKVASVLNVGILSINSIAFSPHHRDYIVELDNAETLLHAKPDFEAMKIMAAKGPFKHEGMITSCLAPPKSACDLHVRVFLPISGVNEDIACGSSSALLAPYWKQRGLNSSTNTYRILSVFSEGPEGHIGGVQKVALLPEQQTVAITAQARHERDLLVTLDNLVPNRPEYRNKVYTVLTFKK
ncbi:MAG: PhzF family phenazine biosynthesis isomerase [Alphaproteobacteria bacterium]